MVAELENYLKTCIDVVSFHREVWVINRYQLIEEADCIVVSDEAKLGKRKYIRVVW